MSTKYVVAIPDQTLLRRNVLTAAKYAIEVIKGQKRLDDIRIERERMMEELTRSIETINKHMGELSKAMPKHTKSSLPASLKSVKSPKKKESKKKAAPKKPKVQKKASKPPEEPKSPHGLDLNALERKLSSIESKLNKL